MSNTISKEMLAKFKTDNSIQYFNFTNDIGCYVLNKTKTAYNKPTGVMFEVNDVVVVLPATVAPIDLCKYAPKDALLKSSSLITALNKGILQIITEEEALKILSTPEMQREAARIAREEGTEENNKVTLENGLNEAKNAGDLNVAITNVNIEIIEAIEAIKEKGLDWVVDRLLEQKLYFQEGDINYIKEKLAVEEGGLEAIEKIFAKSIN